MGNRKEWIEKQRKRLLANPSDPQHGTATGYRYGCHCSRCLKAMLEYQEDYRHRTGYYRS